MDGCYNSIRLIPKDKGCLKVTSYILKNDITVLTKLINSKLDVKATILNKQILVDSSVRKHNIKIYCSLVCSINKERSYWMWDAGEILLWDNNIEIEL
jgi:hypothetical protein